MDVEPSNATTTLYEEIRAWEPENFPINDPPLVFDPVPETSIFSQKDVSSTPVYPRKLSKRIVVALVLAGFILGIGSIYWRRSPNPSPAIAAGDQGATQDSHGARNETVVPSSSIIAALTAVPLPSETSHLEYPSVPVPPETVVSASSAAIDLENQSQALITLYEQTDGSNWENSDGWLADTSPCEWYGVTCRGEKIVKLELVNNQLNGSISAGIGQLGYLENLDLRNNQLSGNIPPEIGTYRN